jgi:hypothetical protein
MRSWESALGVQATKIISRIIRLPWRFPEAFSEKKIKSKLQLSL